MPPAPPRAGAALPAEPGAAPFGPARLGPERSRISGWAAAAPLPSGVPSSFPLPAMNNPPARSP